MTTRHFLGIAEPGERNWSISFPAFPGTATTGDSFSELLARARDALATIVEAMHEDGLDIPAGYDAPPSSPGYQAADYRNPHAVLVPVEVGGRALRINVTMDEGLVARLDHFAGRAHSSRSALLARGARMVLASDAAE